MSRPSPFEPGTNTNIPRLTTVPPDNQNRKAATAQFGQAGRSTSRIVSLPVGPLGVAAGLVMPPIMAGAQAHGKRRSQAHSGTAINSLVFVAASRLAATIPIIRPAPPITTLVAVRRCALRALPPSSGLSP